MKIWRVRILIYSLNYDASLLDNFIDGKALFQLSWSEIREMVHPVGLAKRIMRLVKPKPDESAKTPLKDVRFYIFI